MRRPLFLPLALWVWGACGEPAPLHPEVALIEDFVRRSATVDCRLAADPFRRTAEVRQIRAVGDTALLVLDARDRAVSLFGPGLVEKWRITFDEGGPRGLVDPRSVALAGDSMILVADRSRRGVKAFDLEGHERPGLATGWVVDQLLSIRGALLLSSLVVPGNRAPLLGVLSGEEVRPFPLPGVQEADWRLTALANLVEMVGYPDGRVVVLHRFLHPRAYVWNVEAGGEPATVMVPLPEGLAGAVGYRPPPPFTEESLRGLLAPALDAAADMESGDLLYLTRSGRSRGGQFEKALVRLDQEFRYRRSYLLPVNAGRFAYLSSRAESILIDDWGRWHVCATP